MVRELRERLGLPNAKPARYAYPLNDSFAKPVAALYMVCLDTFQVHKALID